MPAFIAAVCDNCILMGCTSGQVEAVYHCVVELYWSIDFICAYENINQEEWEKDRARGCKNESGSIRKSETMKVKEI